MLGFECAYKYASYVKICKMWASHLSEGHCEGKWDPLAILNSMAFLCRSRLDSPHCASISGGRILHLSCSALRSGSKSRSSSQPSPLRRTWNLAGGLPSSPTPVLGAPKALVRSHSGSPGHSPSSSSAAPVCTQGRCSENEQQRFQRGAWPRVQASCPEVFLVGADFLNSRSFQKSPLGPEETCQGPKWVVQLCPSPGGHVRGAPGSFPG